jgi:hypothetical protein
VLLAATALNDDLGGSSEERRDRLERFKTAAPENALADYLSAREHLKNGRADLAVADLLTADKKTRFQDYSLDAMQNGEELYLHSGKTPIEAKVLGGSTTLLPHLAQLRGLARDMAALQVQYLAGGDTASAENLAQMGMRLGQQLTQGEGSRFLINQLVGLAAAKDVLTPLDAQKKYDFLHDTPAHYLEQMNAQRTVIRENSQYVEQWIQSASEPDLISYFDRIKVFGESEAIAWLRKR